VSAPLAIDNPCDLGRDAGLMPQVAVSSTWNRVLLALLAAGAAGCDEPGNRQSATFGAPEFGEDGGGEDGSAIMTGGETEGEDDGVGTWSGQGDPEDTSSGAGDWDEPLGDESSGDGAPMPIDPLAPELEYRFDDGAGGAVANSGTLDDYDLTIDNLSAVTWQGSSLRLHAPTKLSGPAPAVAFVQGVRSSDAFTVEAWVETASLDQDGPARIVTLSNRSQNRNFTLGQGVVPQGEVDWLARVRSPATDSNGLFEDHVDPLHAGPGIVSTQLTHLVLTRGGNGLAKLWVDGKVESSAELPGALDGWSADFALHLGNEQGSVRPWLGTYHYVALYDRALDGAEIAAHLAAGPD